MGAVSRTDGATELLPLPTSGRTFSTSRRVRLSDTTVSGALRLDAFARYVQDIASDDARETMTASYLAWVVRRAVFDITTPPVSEETCALTTWCSGHGGRWAERRTSLVGDQGGRADAVMLWVAIDPKTGTPARLPDTFHTAYDEAAAGRRVTARLQHADPPAHGTSLPWKFRMADLDRLGHVNNAAYWTVVEELVSMKARSGVVAELEYRDPVAAGSELSVIGGLDAGWLVDTDRTVKASFMTRQKQK
jgi:acyl-ACP thioesterase